MNKDQLDHVEYFGFSLMVFDVYKKKLDPINKQGTWNGFSPRWILPATIRNPMDTNRNTSAILLVIDSQREVDIKLGPLFSQTIIGADQMMITESSAEYL